MIRLIIFFCLLNFLVFIDHATAQDGRINDNNLDLGEEYQEHGKERYGRGKTPQYKKQDSSLVYKTLLFIPNRVLDILDIFRFDVGVGPSIGAVIRVTPHGQAGVRLLMPISVRAGLRGRRLPVFIEHSSEMGIGPAFLSSESRKPSSLEVGAGVDLLLAGAYLGVSIDSIWDALAGFAGFDPADDDL